MRTPEFWQRGGSLPVLLAPSAMLYNLAGQLRRGLTRAARASVPVVCIGNLTAGGAGKTPVTLAVVRHLMRAGRRVHILSRGYGGREVGPVAVDRHRHGVGEVGDEALLLADAAPTWVAHNRLAGARAAVEAGAQIIVMDDGLQNNSLAKDLSLLVIDGGYGFGNGRIIPAGPLRESPARGFARADAVVLVEDPAARNVAIRRTNGLPWLDARLVPDDAATRLVGRPVMAFAGIGRPQKFFATLQALGCRLAGGQAFADHHVYRPDEIMQLVELASQLGAELVTTTKDMVRLPADARAMVTAVAITLEFDDAGALDRLLAPLLIGR